MAVKTKHHLVVALFEAGVTETTAETFAAHAFAQSDPLSYVEARRDKLKSELEPIQREFEAYDLVVKRWKGENGNG